ncbi:MAG: hypothetical protein A2091_13240 [Desulfuromonadales bacterium GWD2_61_12]|nr:MAG: hypothetical protein A2005_07010 [Desulfuromonadales bacterium GWC2_61_20]OGR34827.1 MAG: hypothetical protein A2091_13240 [Desulfuromonadales bacterium GWD2_61_12]HAD04043.1 ribonuclease BN-like protein [Desulfuromonas sp.]HBT82544.1 ribonuclease BN-like protein [Desulfuromonas sp.]
MPEKKSGKGYFAVRLWELLPERYGRIGGFALRQVQALTVVAREFINDNCLMRASALTYVTLLSIVPLLAIMFALLKGFGAGIDIEIFFLNHMALGSEEIIDAIFTYISRTNLAGLGIFGLLTLIFTVLALMSNIEGSFNHIWRVSETRSSFRRFADYLAVVVFGPVFILAAISMTTSLASQTVVVYFLNNTLVGPLLIALFKVVPYLFMWAAFTCLYLFMPNTRVKLSSALLGGIVGGTLWQLLQWGYVSFQFGVARYNAIYGTMAALPIFMVWIYLSWLIVLLGVELTFVHQNLRNLRQEGLGGEVNVASRERAALAIMLTAATVFARGEAALTQGELALRIGLPARLARSLLEQLVRLGFLVEVVTTAELTAFQPARPAAAMTVIDLLSALRHDGIALAPGEEAVELQVAGGMQQRLLSGMEQAAAGVTLQQLVEERADS